MLTSYLLNRLAPSELRQASLWVSSMAAALVLAGCSTKAPAYAAPPGPPVIEAVETPATAVPEVADPVKKPEKTVAFDPVVLVLAQTDRTLRMTSADLTKEIARLTEREESAIENPLLLAVALAQTRQPVDTARALGLVQRVLGNNAPAAQALHPLARLMESRLLQQRRLEDQLDRQSQQLRDAQRRNEQLNERLEAVRAIERSLTTRPTPAPANGGNTPRPVP
jgi:hypothetical protein